MGGENLKGALPAPRRRLGLYRPLCSSPPPNWAALARESHRGLDLSRTLGSAPSPPRAFLSLSLPSPFTPPGGGAGGDSRRLAECVCGGADWGGWGVGAHGAGSGTTESRPLPEAAWGRTAPAEPQPGSGPARALLRLCALRSGSLRRIGVSRVCHLGVPEPRKHRRFSGRGISRPNYFEPVLSEACKFEDSLPG